MTTVTVIEGETIVVTVAEQGPPGVDGAGGDGTDHGELTGLSDDDHTQYHTDERGDLRYAPLADGVTNGDSHDHSNGDGAQIAYSSLSDLPTLGTAAATDSTDYAPASHDHSGVYEPVDATLLRQSDVDDVPVDGVTTAPVSSNWAYDHAALTTAHGISLFGASLVDDASALAARTTLGVPSLHGFEGRTGSSLSLTGAVLTLTVTAQTVWLNGVAYPLTSSLTCDLGTPTVGLHYIVAQDDGAEALELVELVGAWSITNLTYTPVAVVYWNGSAGVVHEERHGHTRNLQLHSYLHHTVGARIENDGSFAQTRPTTVNDGQIELVAGSLWDEDIENDLTTAQCKLVRNWYETASSVWTFADGVNNSGYDRPYLWNSGTSLLRYPNSGSAYALTDVASSRFIPVWVYASNDTTRPIYVVTPALSATYTTVANARAATAPTLPFAAEVKLLYRWIYRGDGEYQEAADYRTASSLPSGGVSAPVAASVVFSPSGNIAATNVQAALEELDSEKLATGVDAADLTSGSATDGHVLTADGAGGAAWEAAAGGDLVNDTSPQLGGNLDLNEKQITGSGGTVTTSQPILDISQTWNDAAVTFTGIKANITNTASAAASLLMDLQVGGVSQFSVGNPVRVLINAKSDVRGLGTTDGGIATGILLERGNGAIGFDNASTFGVVVSKNRLRVALKPSTGIEVCANHTFSWCDSEFSVSAATFSSIDLSLARDAANTLAQRRTTNPQTYRLYNTWTDASNYERLSFTWDSNVAKIQTEAGGAGGTLRDLSIGSTGGKLGFLGATPVARAAHIADADTAHALNATFSDTEVESALNALATKINSIIKILEDFGFKVTS